MWFFYLVQSVRNVEFDFIPVKEEADITVGNEKGYTFDVSVSFYDKLSLELFDHSVYFEDNLMVYADNGEEDLISTVFYLVNCIQEYNADDIYLDKYGRFKQDMSVQHKFGIGSKNLVVELIDIFLSKCGITSGVKQKSKIYISHDIDFLTSGFRQEFIWSLKTGQIGKSAVFVKNLALGKSPWDNINEVIDLDISLNIPSTFYWLNYKERGKEGIQNADYTLEKEWLETVKSNGLTNGLHKSATDYTIKKEVGDFPEEVRHNRYHFLKFNLPYAWEELHKSKIKTDASLGFSRGINLRNSFGLPFYPYNLRNEMPYRTLVLPLQIMDVALSAHGSGDRHKIVEEVMGFINDNKTDSVISLLFHNNELTPYSNKYMQEAYTDIVDIIHESGLDIIGLDQVVEEYG